MTLVISLASIEKIIFYNEDIKKLFPEFDVYFRYWLIGKQTLNHDMCKDSLRHVIRQLNSAHLDKLEHFLGQSVLVELDLGLVANHAMPVNNLEAFLRGRPRFSKNFSMSRDESNAYLSFWR